VQRLSGGEAGEHVADRFWPGTATLGEHLGVATLEEDLRRESDCDRWRDRE
jgi:hypothetical protein